MRSWLDDGDVRLYHGSALNVLAELPAESVQTVVTSPPYWGLRDYGTAEWNGGTGACDHLQPVSYKSSTLGASTGGRSEETHARSIGAQVTPYRDVCARCGGVFNMRHESYSGMPPRHWHCAYPPTPVDTRPSHERGNPS